ncbi:MAG: SEL1-like repeat protein [Alphaproteobacteria bacterium]|nr:SEL1-like repeat protein [Alphaproteobacteria bacterium]
MASALADARPALASVAAGESAFNNGAFMTAVREFQGPAYGGNAVAQYYMGVIYAHGLGVGQSLEDGLAWLICAQTVELPSALGREAKRQQSAILSLITSYGVEIAEKHAKTLCGQAIAEKKKAVARKKFAGLEDQDPFENVRPVRGFWAMLFFFPGDTMVTGAVVVFYELGLSFVSNLLVGMVKLSGDLLFGLLALIGWFVIARFLRLFLEPVWQRILAPGASAHNATEDASPQPEAQDANPD